MSGEEIREVAAPVPGAVTKLLAAPGQVVAAGDQLLLLEVMKMEHPVVAPAAGRVEEILVAEGASVAAGEPVLVLRTGPGAATPPPGGAPSSDPGGREGGPRADLAELLERRRFLADDAPARSERVEARHAAGHRTIRENIADLCDPGSFEEWGGLVVAAQRTRRDLAELIERTPGDGLVAGIATVDGRPVAVAGYDYLVLAGTQGARNHRKKDRLFEIVRRLGLPLVLFAEGGGGRPGDTDYPVIAGLDTMAFALFARLSGLVPTVGIVTGFCFAGNAALLGCCDVVIATSDSSIGMGGPAMIEGGGLGTVAPEQVGPIEVQTANGVVDLVARDDAEAVALAKRYLSYFDSELPDWTCEDQDRLRSLVPERRTLVYDVRAVVAGLFDSGSVLELRPEHGVGIVTALARIEGRPIGVIANNPAHLGGAIDADAADKAARHVQLCDAYGLPIVSLCDTPGFMVGPEAERTGQVRRFARMFVTAASITVPYVTVVLRKGYGLGAQAMAGGSFHACDLTVSWPTGEFGGMGLEGAVRLAFRRELEAADGDEREALYERLVASMYERGKALSMAMNFEIDDVIDPAETRRRIMNVLGAAPPSTKGRTERRRPLVDPY
ncbi:MAG TPA: carboxyl transferase domain-containing protein [Acidimicrobiales bacterium]|nr:carboxyl transferase domain-containing protein [Acidimicrobiales bacterium]